MAPRMSITETTDTLSGAHTDPDSLSQSLLCGLLVALHATDPFPPFPPATATGLAPLLSPASPLTGITLTADFDWRSPCSLLLRGVGDETLMSKSKHGSGFQSRCTESIRHKRKKHMIIKLLSGGGGRGGRLILCVYCEGGEQLQLACGLLEDSQKRGWGLMDCVDS
jgi:hypothetical protein